ncbi:putative serine/threonine-protein kinase [Chlorella vulgaris]
MPVLMQGEKLEGQEGGRWEVVKKIGEGQFSEVYLVLELGSQDERALKIEKTSRVRTVKAEYKILQRLQDKCRQSVRVYECGEYPCPGPTSRFFMVMDLLGCNLAHVRRTALPEGQADPQTALVVGCSMLRALEEVHAQGFIHRDVKPANFCAKRGTEGTPSKITWTLVDFGLAKQYMTDQGVLLDARPEASFRGSSTYASVNCHEGQDQSRRDDLWGWLYCLVELLDGTLPWRAERDAPPGGGTWAGGDVPAQLLPSPPQDGQPGPLQGQQQAGAGTGALRRDEEKEQIRQSKLQCLQQPQLLFSTMPCPQAVVEISAYLQRLGFADKPDYQWLRGRLLKLGDEGEAQAGPTPQLAPEPVATNGVGHRGEEAATRQAPAEHGCAQPQLESTAAAAAGVSGADGASRDGQPPVQQQKQQEQQQQERVEAPGLSKQRSRDRDRSRDKSRSRSRARSRSRGGDRQRDGRGWEDGSRDGDRGRAQRGGTRERSSSRGRRSSSRGRRSRSRGRRSRSRSREPRRRSRSRSRSRSRQRDGGRERRERPRDREQERDGARASRRSRSPERSRERDLERPARNRRQRFGRQRSQERRGGGARSSEGVQRRGGTRSRSRTPLQQRADRGGRDRDRGGGAGGRQQRRREERASDVPAASPDAAAATGAARDYDSTPAAAFLEHLPAPHGIGGAAEPALPPSGGAAAEPLAAAGRAGGTAYSADRHAQYRGLLEYVFALRQGALSEPAAAACRQLRGLEPSEAAGVLCWLLDELATATEPRHLPAVSAFCEELSAFAAGTAKRCLERAQQGGQQQQQPEPQQEERR